MTLQSTKLTSPSSRASPFRRAESPSSPSPSTPKYQSTRPATPSRLQNSSVANADGTWSPSTQHLRSVTPREAPLSPTRNGNGVPTTPRATTTTTVSGGAVPVASSASVSKTVYNTDALGKLPPAQVREMREAFQILDRDSDGFVDREDVVEMLGQLGMDSSMAATSTFFPAQSQHPYPMPAYLGSLSSSLAQMSPPSELLAALSAFDDDDSGQVDVADLTDALLHTAPETGDGRKPLDRNEIAQVMQEFAGKRAFSKHSTTTSLNRGDVFRYREWVSSLQAVGGQGEKAQVG